jgi:hypothetical protein
MGLAGGWLIPDSLPEGGESLTFPGQRFVRRVSEAEQWVPGPAPRIHPWALVRRRETGVIENWQSGSRYVLSWNSVLVHDLGS